MTGFLLKATWQLCVITEVSLDLTDQAVRG